MSRPQAVFVQLQPLVLDAAEDHRAEVPLPIGSASLSHLVAGLAIPERQRVCGSGFLRRERRTAASVSPIPWINSLRVVLVMEV